MRFWVITTLLLIVFVIDSKSDTIIANDVNGNWRDAGTWNLLRVPAPGDLIIIPPGTNVNINNLDAAVLELCDPAVETVIQVQGTLTFNDAITAIRLDVENMGASDRVEIAATGSILNISGSDLNFVTFALPGQCATFSSLVQVTTAGIPGPATIVNGVLPIDLVFFSGHEENGVLNLVWQTSYEENFSHFEIEKSVNGYDWERIDKVFAQGGLNETTNYFYNDYLPVNGFNYYRLKAVDYDATFEYSSVINILSEGTTNEITIYPNPVQSTFQLQLNFVPEGEGIVQVFDRNGIAVLRESLSSYSDEISFPANLTNGTYLVQTTVGDKVYMSRLIKQ